MLALAITATAIAALAMLTLIYRVLKAAHSRPRTAPAGSDGHSHSPLERVVLTTISSAIRAMLRAGLPLGPMRMLTLPGRTTGLPRTNPVDLFQHDGRYFLVATHTAQAAWVRNLRAAGSGELTRGRNRVTFTAVQLQDDQAAVILKNVIGARMARPVAGFVLRQTIGIEPDASLGEYRRITTDHPVFELTLTPADKPRNLRHTTRPSAPALLIGGGTVVALVHLALGITGIMTAAQWSSGVIIGLFLAGLGNHLRIFGRR